MRCEVEGVIIVALPVVNGITSKGDEFEKREFVLQRDDWYKKKMKFSMISFGGPMEDYPEVGDSVSVKFTVEAMESKGRWFNEVRAYNITRRG